MSKIENSLVAGSGEKPAVASVAAPTKKTEKPAARKTAARRQAKGAVAVNEPAVRPGKTSDTAAGSRAANTKAGGDDVAARKSAVSKAAFAAGAKPGAAGKAEKALKPVKTEKKLAARTGANVADKDIVKTSAKPAAGKKLVAKAGVKTNARTAALNGAASAKPADLAAREKAKKPKLVRDSFTMPETEYAVLSSVKKQCIKAGFDVKKSELLRVGVALIKSLSQANLKKALAALPPLKVGRPKAEK